MNKLPVYEAKLINTNHIELISFVENPAIQEEFVYFSEQKEKDYFESVDQMIVVAPVLVPNKLIDRKNDLYGYYQTYFSIDTIKKIQYQFARDNNYNKSNLNHDKNLNGIVMIETWIKEFDEDKSNEYGFKLPIGSWFAKYKIDNKDLWTRIKKREIRGMSIEGYLSYQFDKYIDKYFAFDQPKTNKYQDNLKRLF